MYEDLNVYQKKAMETCLASCYNHEYMSTLLCSEVGEYQGYIGKLVRKGIVKIDDNTIRWQTNDSDVKNEAKDKILSELGDILWAVAGTARMWGFELSEVAEYNNKKLAERKAKDTIINHTDH